MKKVRDHYHAGGAEELKIAVYRIGLAGPNLNWAAAGRRRLALKKSIVIRKVTAFLIFIVIGTVTNGCSEEDAGMLPVKSSDIKGVALQFAEALTDRDYPKAYAMVSTEYKNRMSLDNMKLNFEAIVPSDWGPIGSIEIAATHENFPDKQPSDLGWIYVSIGGDVYSEAVTVVITLEDGEAKIRAAEFGRP